MNHRARVDRTLNGLLQREVARAKSRVPLVFIADDHGEVTAASHSDYYAHVGISPAAQAAFDIMHDDGLSAEKAWKLALEMDRQGDAEAQARHLVKLRKAMRE